ncbi:hypothetical protein HK104_001532 [Borealophlyctis nickersoniae]|nr:hypothetical protein HK104_001532 [Borealophlyctis nickersoniae]
MAPSLLSTLLLVPTLLAPLISAHGHMTVPAPRIDSAQPNNDYLRNPWDNTKLGGCGSVAGKPRSKFTSVTPGAPLTVEWEIGFWTGAALHQGTIDVQISKSGSESGWESLGTVSMQGKSTVADTPHSTVVTLPKDLKSGDTPILRWFWKAGVTPETYINCADLKVGGGAAGGGSGTGGSKAPTPSKVPTVTTRTVNRPTTTQAPKPPAPAKTNNPPPSAPTKTNNPPPSAGGSSGASCTVGDMKCTAVTGQYLHCAADGKYITRQCASGLKCHQEGAGLYCGW